MCRVVGVNRTSFHDWERRPPSDRALSDAWLTEKIKQIHDASGSTAHLGSMPSCARARGRGRAQTRRPLDESRRYRGDQAA